jgi:hypothetical protein
LLAAATLLMIVGFAFAANAYFQWLPLRLFALCAAFTLCIAAYLLVSGILYVLDGELMIAFGTLLGTAVSAALFLIVKLPLLVSQIIGLALAVATFSFFAQLRFIQLGSRAPIKVPLPPPGRLLFMLWPYFVYGTLYYSFLFADRIVAWTAHTQLSALPLQFRGEYETALDVCLFAFVLQVGWIHAGLVRFYRIVSDEQRRISIRNRKNLRRTLGRFYARQTGVLGTLCIASTSIVLWGINSLPALKAILLFRVAVLALAGIPFAAAALWNIALLFALSRPILAVVATAWGLAANVSTGYLLSRLFTYDYAVIGFDVGALTMAVISAWSCRRILSKFDYHFFAAAA